MELVTVYDQVEEFLDLLVVDLELDDLFGTQEEAKEALLHSLHKEREDIVLELLVGDVQGYDIDIQLASSRLIINHLNHSEYRN